MVLLRVFFPTGHAVELKQKDGIECIVHIGLDTVELNGEGFTSLISKVIM